jgi:hypothetical protein
MLKCVRTGQYFIGNNGEVAEWGAKEDGYIFLSPEKAQRYIANGAAVKGNQSVVPCVVYHERKDAGLKAVAYHQYEPTYSKTYGMQHEEGCLYIYCDGGVFKKNPSPVGGGWAYCAVIGNGKRGQVSKTDGDRIIIRGIVPIDVCDPAKGVTSQNAETYAMMKALHLLSMVDHRAYPKVVVVSDSMTALGWAFLDWSTKSMPQPLRDMFEEARDRVKSIDNLHFLHVEGHPGPRFMKKGWKMKNGKVVFCSIWNVLCDRHVGRAMSMEWDLKAFYEERERKKQARIAKAKRWRSQVEQFKKEIESGERILTKKKGSKLVSEMEAEAERYSVQTG